jgi:DNA-binding NtrC family response regulator
VETSRHAVLVVEDDLAMLDLVVSLLEEGGIEARPAQSGEEGLAQLQERDFDAVLSDVEMPGMNGIALLGESRRVRPGVPVILMSATPRREEFLAQVAARPFAWLRKPFRRDELLETLQRAFEQRIQPPSPIGLS